jgi:hypothetical protein
MSFRLMFASGPGMPGPCTAPGGLLTAQNPVGVTQKLSFHWPPAGMLCSSL